MIEASGDLAPIAAGSHSFAAAARLFDRATRDSVVRLYAWCRHCDDVIDGQILGHGAESRSSEEMSRRLAILEAKTRDALAGEARDPVFAGFSHVIRRHAVPHALPLEHLAGYRMDAEGRRYRTIEDTLVYCYHVAGVVGIIMAHVMGVRERAVMDRAFLDRACDLGIAFQLTNMARDIVPDAEAGRLYLPEEWLDAAGIPLAEVAAPRHREHVAAFAARLVETAELYYASALIGIGQLPARAAWAVATARGVYRDIGLEVVRRGPRAWDDRVSTSAARKLGHVARAAFLAPLLRGFAESPRDGLWMRPGGHKGLAASDAETGPVDALAVTSA